MTRRRLERKIANLQGTISALYQLGLNYQGPTHNNGVLAPIPQERIEYVELGKEKYRVRISIKYKDKSSKIIQFHIGSLEDYTRRLQQEFRKLPNREDVFEIHTFMGRID